MIVEADWGRHALAVAELLDNERKTVALISSNLYIGAGIDMVTRTSYYSGLYDNVHFHPLTSLESLRGRVTIVRNVITDKVFQLEPIDQVIFVSGAIPRNTLYNELKDHIDNLYRIGDCVDAHGIPEAILDGNRLARKL